MPYFISCSSIDKDAMKDFRIIIQEQPNSRDPTTGQLYCHQSFKLDATDSTTGYFIPFTKFEVVKVGNFSYNEYLKGLEEESNQMLKDKTP